MFISVRLHLWGAVHCVEHSFFPVHRKKRKKNQAILALRAGFAHSDGSLHGCLLKSSPQPASLVFGHVECSHRYACHVRAQGMPALMLQPSSAKRVKQLCCAAHAGHCVGAPSAAEKHNY